MHIESLAVIGIVEGQLYYERRDEIRRVAISGGTSELLSPASDNSVSGCGLATSEAGIEIACAYQNTSFFGWLPKGATALEPGPCLGNGILAAGGGALNGTTFYTSLTIDKQFGIVRRTVP